MVGRDGGNRRLMIIALLSAVIATVVVLREEGSEAPWAASELFSDHLQIIVMVSSTCHASRQLTRQFISSMADAIARDAADHDLRIRTVGVATDPKVKSGTRFLMRLYPAFDEIVAGGGWLNSGTLLYMLREEVGPAAVPQVVVIHRAGSRDLDDPSIGEDYVLMRKVGVRELEMWEEQGFPVGMLE